MQKYQIKSDLIFQYKKKVRLEHFEKFLNKYSFKITLSELENLLIDKFSVKFPTIIDAGDAPGIERHILMILFGVVDKNPDKRHNKEFVEFLKSTGNTTILNDIQSYWDNPITSKIFHCPSSIIYKSSLSLQFNVLFTLDSSPKKLLLLPNESYLKQEYIPIKKIVSLKDADLSSLYCAARI